MGRTVLIIVSFSLACLLPGYSHAESSFDDLMDRLADKIIVIEQSSDQLLTTVSAPRSIDAKKTAIKIDNHLNLKLNVNPFNSREHFQTIYPSSEPEYEVGLALHFPF